MSEPVIAAPGRETAVRKWLLATAVVLLLAGYLAAVLGAARQKGLSFDEGEHIAIGCNVWFNHDFRMESGNGDLVKRWATLPLLVSRPKFVAHDVAYLRAARPYELAFRFFFELGNDPEAILFRCRAMIALVGVATGLLIFFCAKDLFGAAGGLVALTVFVTSPNMLVFGGLVTTEMTSCFALLGAVWASWRLLHEISPWRLAVSLFFAGVVVLAKPTAVILFPIAALLIAWKLASGAPTRCRWWPGGRIVRRWHQLACFAAVAVLHIAAGWSALWAHYGFRYASCDLPRGVELTADLRHADPISPVAAAVLDHATRHRWLPEGFIDGIRLLLHFNESQPAFMNGEWRVGGWLTFFPYAAWAKTQPALLLLLVLAAVALIVRWRNRGTARSSDDAWRSPWPFACFAAVYFGTAIFWDMNIGMRHILPVYPAIYVLSGAAGLLWSRRAAQAVIAALLGWHAVVSAQLYPHFLAYFSPLVGGPREGYRRLVDSSLDWGMDLPGLKQWLAVHNPDGRDPLFLAYFGVGNPDYWGIRSLRLPGRPDWRRGPSYPLAPGIYAISATLLQGIGTPTVGRWNKVYEKAYWKSLATIDTYDRSLSNPGEHARLLAAYPANYWTEAYARFEWLRFGRLCAWLRHHRPPDDEIGYSILIWRLSKAEIFDAGLGPPVELADEPLIRAPGA
jgi:hypothetical protein